MAVYHVLDDHGGRKQDRQKPQFCFCANLYGCQAEYTQTLVSLLYWAGWVKHVKPGAGSLLLRCRSFGICCSEVSGAALRQN